MLSISMFLTLLGCKKEVQKANENFEQNIEEISVKNGLLIFRDSNVFRKYYAQILSKGGTKNDAWAPNFVSYRTIYNKAQENFSKIENQEELNMFLFKNSKNILFNDKDKSLSPIYTNPALMSFINADGRFMIGNQLQILTSDAYITVDNPTPDRVNRALLMKKSDTKTGISIHKKLMSTSNQNLGKLLLNSTVNGMIHEVTYYNEDGKRRLFVQIFDEYDPTQGKNHMYLGLFQQKKGTFGGWSNNQTDIYFDNLTFEATLQMPPPVLPNFTAFSGPTPLSYNWQNVTGPVYYGLGFYSTNTGQFYTYYYSSCFLINFRGRFFSGGVPNAPVLQYN